MRLVCPNCAAQYEVDDNAIPETGRDVQCSSCGSTWFQEQPKPGAQQAGTDPEHPMVAASGEGADDSPPEEAEAPMRPRRVAHDPKMLDILRREVDRERNERRDERPPAGDAAQPASGPDSPEGDLVANIMANAGADADADTGAEDEPDHAPAPPSPAPPQPAPPQPEDTGADAAPDNTADGPQDDQALRARIQQSRLEAGDDIPRPVDNTPLSATPKRGQRPAARDLPDIDELNSTLQPAPQPAQRPANGRARRKAEKGENAASGDRGGRIGFYLAILIVLIGLAVYALAPQIAKALPSVGSGLEIYVALVDDLRRLLADGANAAIKAIRDLLAQVL